MKLINLSDQRIWVEFQGEDFTQDAEMIPPGKTIEIPEDCGEIIVR